MKNLSFKKSLLIIIIVGSLLFFKSLFNSFALDDGTQIVTNQQIQSITNLPSFFLGSTFYNGGLGGLNGVYYKPLLLSYFSLIYTFFGANFLVFHLFRVVLHIVNACLVFILLKRYLKQNTAFFLSLIFMVSPINSEAVFYLAAAQEVLFAFFGLLAFLYLEKIKSAKQILILTILLLCSLLSKETGILFVLISLVSIFLFYQTNLRKTIIAPIIATGVYLFLRINAVGVSSNPVTSPIDKLGLAQRTINMPKMFYFYLKTFFYPADLASSWNWVVTKISWPDFYLPLLIDLVFLLTVVWIGWKVREVRGIKVFKIYLFFFIWFCLGMLLHLQIIPLDVTVAERWFYFPVVGLLGMIGVVWEVRDIKIKPSLVLAMACLIVAILSSRTFVRSFDWAQPMTLYSHDIKISDDYVLENAIGGELFSQGKPLEAKSHIEKSISLFPLHNNYLLLGAVDIQLRDYTGAKNALEQSLKYGDFYLTYEELGGLTLVTGTPKENIPILIEAVSKFPQDSDLWLYLAIAEYRAGNVNNAKTAINQVIKSNRSNSVIYIYNSIMNNQPLNINTNLPKPS